MIEGLSYNTQRHIATAKEFFKTLYDEQPAKVYRLLQHLIAVQETRQQKRGNQPGHFDVDEYCDSPEFTEYLEEMGWK